MSTSKKSKAAKAKAARTKQKAAAKKSTPAAGRTTRKVGKAKAAKGRKASTRSPRAPEHKGREEIRVEAAADVLPRVQPAADTGMPEVAASVASGLPNPGFEFTDADNDAPGFTSLLLWIVAMLVGFAFLVLAVLTGLHAAGVL